MLRLFVRLRGGEHPRKTLLAHPPLPVRHHRPPDAPAPVRLGQIQHVHERRIVPEQIPSQPADSGAVFQRKEDLILPKKSVGIIENPLFAIINEPNSTMQRLIRKLVLLDAIDEQSGSGKLDLIIQLPYVIKSAARRQQAEDRRKDIEMQLAGSKYGIAYTDGTERITQLNRPVENNLMKQIEYLTDTLYGQLGITQEILDGSADEKTMLNYYSRTIEPIISAIVDEMKRKFLTKTARSQRQSIVFFRNPFKLVPVGELAEVADKMTRNEIMTSNEIRQEIGLKPSNDPKADQLVNSNLNQPEKASEPVANPTEVIEEGGNDQNG